HNAGQGPAGRIERIAILAVPPDLDAGEITDQGYVNQRRVLANRADLVDLLYADPAPRGVITPAPFGLTPYGCTASPTRYPAITRSGGRARPAGLLKLADQRDEIQTGRPGERDGAAARPGSVRGQLRRVEHERRDQRDRQGPAHQCVRRPDCDHAV